LEAHLAGVQNVLERAGFGRDGECGLVVRAAASSVLISWQPDEHLQQLATARHGSDPGFHLPSAYAGIQHAMVTALREVLGQAGYTVSIADGALCVGQPDPDAAEAAPEGQWH